MTIFRLPEKKYIFPPTTHAESDGLLAFGGDLKPARLLAAYQKGIFPWYSAKDPILWWFTSPRMVIFPEEFHIPKRVARYQQKSDITIHYDHDFRALITLCANLRYKQGKETWIHQEMVDAYTLLHQLGYAHSVECWLDGELVGGLYGVELDSVFFGESMVSKITNASQFALIALVKILKKRGCAMIDCQVTTEHLQRFGGREIKGDEFRQHLANNIKILTAPHQWQETVENQKEKQL